MSEDEIILTHILKCSRAQWLVAKPLLDQSQEKQYQEIKLRRKNGEPLQYILGSWNFYGLEYDVTPNVLIPRPETEILVDVALKYFKGTDILDLGVGSGAIAVTLANILPYVHVDAVDISIDAIEVAISNAQRHGVESRVEFIHDDMQNYLKDCQKKYNLIISNPPYIARSDFQHLPKDVLHEPSLALDGGEDGLDYFRIIINYSHHLISSDGYLMMEFGDGQADAIKNLIFEQKAFSHCDILKDLAGRDRIVMAHLRR